MKSGKQALAPDGSRSGPVKDAFLNRTTGKVELLERTPGTYHRGSSRWRPAPWSRSSASGARAWGSRVSSPA
jgi:hypothetical protein